MVPFFDRPLEPGVLGRYKLSRIEKPAPEWMVENAIPIDPDYDTHFRVSVYVDGRGYGMSTTSGPEAWIPDFRDRVMRASKAYTQARGSPAVAVSDLFPYFDPPLDPAVAAKIAAKEKRDLSR